MDSPRRSTANRSRSISITTRRASASSSFQVRCAAASPGLVVRAPSAPSPDGDAADGDAARLIDHATDRPPGRHNHTSPSRRSDSPLFFSLPLDRVEVPRTSRWIAGRYLVLCREIRVLLSFFNYVSFLLIYLFLCLCTPLERAVGANCTCFSLLVVLTSIMDRWMTVAFKFILFTR